MSENERTPQNNPALGGSRFYIDRGGTFTDVLAQSPDGAIRNFKLLSEDPHYYDDDARNSALRACRWRRHTSGR